MWIRGIEMEEYNFAESKAELVQGYDVYSSDEFKAFCKRFNIPYELGTKSIKIEIPCEGLMTVTHEYYTKHPEHKEVIDTTTTHNVHYRTAEPNRAE
jgi:hypothetical protein